MQKHLLLLLAIFGLVHPAFSQECDIALRTIISPSSNGLFLPQADEFLHNKLRTLCCQSSGLSAIDSEQFAIAAAYDVLDKQIVSGTPTKIIYNISFTLFIVDTKNRKIYESYNTTIKSVGDNETKAIINAFSKVNTNNQQIQTFAKNGKKKIIDFYNTNYQNIIKSAQTLAVMKDFDAAIYQLSCIPECCIGHDSVIAELKKIYQQFVDQHCAENIAQARAAWYSSPNEDGASVASIYLSEIYPDAACYSDALSLYDEIKKQMGENWKFAMQRWSDEIELERQRLNAIREIGIAYATSLPKEINVFWK